MRHRSGWHASVVRDDGRPLSPADAAALLADPRHRTRVSVLYDHAVLAVDLSEDPAPDLSALRRLPVVVVGVGATADDRRATVADVVVPDDDARWAVAASVYANPQAAVTLVQTLRVQEHLDPYDALVVESLAYATLQRGIEYEGWLAAQPRRVRPPNEAPLRVEHDGDRVEITFDRPRLFNAFDAATRDALAAVLTSLPPDTREVVLRGAGRSFGIGGDLAEFGSVSDPATGHLIRSTANVAPLLWAWRDKLIAHVHGPVVGAGVELAAVAGRVVADPASTFALPEVSMGLIPGAGGTVSVARRIGRHRAAWFAITGERIDASTALAWGLVDEVR